MGRRPVRRGDASRCKIGLMTVFESPVLSLEDQAIALEASAEAFNARGGANGACIEVTTCDDGANVDQAVGVRARRSTTPASSPPSTTRAPPARPRCRRRWPRRASPGSRRTSRPEDWGDQNAYPLDASGTGVTFLMPQALIDAGVDRDRPRSGSTCAAASALVEPPRATPTRARPPSRYDVPVPAGTTDFSQFILGCRGRRRRRRGPRPRRAGGRPGGEGRPAARHRPASSGRASARSRTRTSPSSATSPSRWCSSGRSRRRPPTSRSTRRSAPTWRPPARRRSSPRTSRPARCGRGSASTPCSR